MREGGGRGGHERESGVGVIVMKCSSMIDLRTYGPNNEGTLTGDASLCLTLLPSPCGTQ